MGICGDTDGHCSCWPEHWVAWNLDKFSWTWNGFWRLWKITYIGDCCAIHDTECKSIPFYNCLYNHHIVGAWFIMAGGKLGCLVQDFDRYLKDDR